MVQIPDSICNGVFDKEFKRGSVVKTLFRCRDGKDRFKFFIILNHDPQKEPILFFLTTSQLDFYDKFPTFNKDIIRIQAGQLSYFTKETIINCKEVHKVSNRVLKNNFRNNILRFEGILPLEILRDIDRIVEQSFFISKQDKEVILGNSSSPEQNQ